ncbi:hypothetical protein G6F46_007721 [Rhizopus delemar]|uniref:Uncharacterized protein n=2 Tax=Rhizopus TaxID=4842 RepID=A0A9P6Z091_9FUNG|nr:hypothetical protein G6F55_006573 [Rhizopus delemar]KAG1541277.1 hypothetical protein G6F51_007993 [Rhizopus arrhizus]KAG1495351.1 hypothetical protein G6F54_007235 [Rhizopus delemar]KAG1509444.1 hypothetical protein G6F53_007443 [Rhizopus delemar]KAG1525018.1 hypothetical protein G6F52_003694 [Rhizopus delemar]
MDLKRKLEFDQEEEDEWEREVGHLTKKPAHNPYATHVEVLDKQFKDLMQMSEDLNIRLLELQNNLTGFEHEEDKVKENISSLKHQCDTMLNDIFETLKEKQDEETGKEKEEEEYYEKDEMLSNIAHDLLKDWETVLLSMYNIDDIDLEMDSLSHSFKVTEFDIIDLTAQIDGYQARIKALNTERESLDGLPQTLPLLTSHIKKHQEEIDSINNMLERLERDTIRPCLVRLSNLKINLPLDQLQQKKDILLMKDIISDLDMLYTLSLKQRAYQQLISYVHDQPQEDCLTELIDIIQQYNQEKET